MNSFKDHLSEAKDKGEYDYEGSMAKTQLRTMIDAAQSLHDMLEDDENMPEWVQGKITKATDYIDTARDYMKSQANESVNEEELEELGPTVTVKSLTKSNTPKPVKKSMSDLRKDIDAMKSRLKSQKT